MNIPVNSSRRFTVRSRNRLAATLATGAMLTLPACTSSDDDNAADKPSNNTASAQTSTTAPAPSSPSPSADPAQVAEREAIARYRAYWREMERVYAKASVEGTNIKEYAALAALSRPEHEVEQLQKNGRRFTGSVTMNNPSAEVTLNRRIPNAVITSCLDVSQWKPIEADTGEPIPLPTKRLTRYIMIGTVERWPDGWKVIKDEPQAGRPC
ncbi:hypothetical protein [Streptomyces sp. NPDC093094]|uniref:hypothetical protein n=1 Tax=Streptomyces sp. NPDC093094 TaxID=3366026 RepID=UPI0037F1513A